MLQVSHNKGFHTANIVGTSGFRNIVLINSDHKIAKRLKEIYQTSVEVVVQQGRKAISSAIKELESKGYLRNTKLLSSETEDHKVQYQYDIYDTPQGAVTSGDAQREPAPKVHAEKEAVINTNKTENNTKEYKTKKETKFAAPYQEEFDQLWKKYPRKVGYIPAYNAYIKAREQGTSGKEIENGLIAYLWHIEDNNIDSRYVLTGQRWFEENRWMDDLQGSQIHQPGEIYHEWDYAELERQALRNPYNNKALW